LAKFSNFADSWGNDLINPKRFAGFKKEVGLWRYDADCQTGLGGAITTASCPQRALSRHYWVR